MQVAWLHIFADVLRNAVLISGLVVVMMMMIECLNIGSHGKAFASLSGNRLGGVLLGAFLGVIPGCLGGFATVSLYTHRMLSFGALVAMMIASSGDESFVLMAMVPDKAWWIFLLLFVLSVAVGLVTDVFVHRQPEVHCDAHYELHEADVCDTHNHECHEGDHHHGRHFGFRRGVMIAGVALFVTALAAGLLEHEEAETVAMTGGLNLLSEDWMNIMFAVLSISVLFVLVRASDHFVDEHLWRHVVVKHLPSVFAWSFSVLLLISVLLRFVDLESWINGNVILMIVLAAAVGFIPESGPHLVFVTLYAAGVLPLPVLLASCISQDGHASLPLVAESKSAFVKAKIINFAVAVASGLCTMLFV